MSFESIEKVLEFAIDREKEAVAFYTDLINKEHFPPAKDTFQEFVLHEQKHVELIQKFQKDRSVLDGYKVEDINDLHISDYMVEQDYVENMIYPDIVTLAMKREEAAVKLYKDLAAKAEDEKIEKLFNVLATEELKHKNKLETIYDDFMAAQDM